MKKMILFFAAIFFIGKIFAEITAFVDVNRFLDDKHNTKYEIAYQIPYNQIGFQRVKGGYRAVLKIILSLKKDGKTVYSKPLLRQLLESNDITNNSNFSYQDKLHFSLSKPGFELSLKFIDLVKKDSTVYEKKLYNFPPNMPMSDLELDYNVAQDTTVYKKNFHRGKTLFLGNQNHIINKLESDTLFVYYELYRNQIEPKKIHLIVTKNDSIIKDKNFNCPKLIKYVNPFLYRLDISDYSSGYYIIKMKVLGQGGQFLTEKKNFFIIRAPKNRIELIFHKLKDDKKLVEYFLNSKQKKILRSLKDEKAVTNYITKFWITHDLNPATEVNEFLQEIRRRVDFANENFSSFSKGWETDRGRIYIKYGKPDFRKKYTTDPSSKYPFKNYEVWQYRSQRDQTYIFFDMQSNNTYRLIYSGNDSSENSYPNWKRFVGEEFDLNDLE